MADNVPVDLLAELIGAVFTDALNALARLGYPGGWVIRYIEENPELSERAIGTSVDPNSLGGLLLVILAAALSANLAAAGVDANSVALGELINPDAAQTAAGALDTAVQDALAGAISSVFVAALVAAVLALGVTALAPRERIARRRPDAPRSAPETPGGD